MDDIQNGQMRDWNEEIQTLKSLKTDELEDRIMRERSLYRVTRDMAVVAFKGAQLLVEGSIKPMNPTGKLQDQLFIWNNLFFSISCDSKGFFKQVGGDSATKSATLLDLQGVEIINRLNIKNIYTLGTTVVDYYGYRILVQSIIPGIFQMTSDDIVVYGTVEMSESPIKYNQIMDEETKSFKNQLKIRPVTFKNLENCTPSLVTLNVSIDCKGILGSDGRYYLIDNYKIFPPDPIFIDDEMNKSKYLPDNFNFAIKYTKLTHNYEFSEKRTKNKIRVFREEFVDYYFANEYLKFTSLKEKDIQKITHNNVENEMNILDNLLYSPDCFNKQIKLDDNQYELMIKDQAFCHCMAYYFVSFYIPEISSQIQKFTLYSGESLTRFFHFKGINMRYLGYFTTLINSKCLKYAYKICVSEMIIRASKEYFRSILSLNTKKNLISVIISHYLNCFLGNHLHPQTNFKNDVKISRKGKRKLNNLVQESNEINDLKIPWNQLTPLLLWKLIQTDVFDKFGFEIKCSSISELKLKYEINCSSLLKRFCQVHGIQIISRDYDFTTNKHFTFYADDIVSLYPIVKKINIQSIDAINAINLARELMYSYKEECLKQAYDILLTIISHLTQIYDLIHPQIALAFHMLAKISYLKKDFQSAIYFETKVVQINEKYFGIDHHETINSYVNLGLYHFNCNNVVSGIRVMNRAIYLITLVYGSDHPEIITLYTNIALLLVNAGKHEQSIPLLKNAISIIKKWSFNDQSLNLAVVSLLLSKQQLISTFYKDAIISSKESFKIFKTLYGMSHQFTIEASTIMSKATKLAVTTSKITKSQNYSIDCSLFSFNSNNFDLIKMINDLKLSSEQVFPSSFALNNKSIINQNNHLDQENNFEFSTQHINVELD